MGERVRLQDLLASMVPVSERFRVYPDGRPDAVEWKGKSRSGALRYIRETYGIRAYNSGRMRVAEVIG